MIRIQKKDYFIAEIGVNHGANIKLAKKCIDLAVKGGANAVKFQAYKAEKLASKFAGSYWDKSAEKENSQLKLYKKLDKFNNYDYKVLADYSKKRKVDFILTPFDTENIDFFKKIVRFFKISSSDLTNYPLVEKIAKTKKPIILSTGASTMSEIKETINLIKKSHNKIILLHCILNYPTTTQNANIGMVDDLKKLGYEVGISDHTLPNDSIKVLSYAYSRGVRYFEKHFTFNKLLKGNDHFHAFDYKDLIKLKEEFKFVEDIIGQNKKKYLPSEKVSRKQARRSIYYNLDLKKDKKIEISDLIMLRPDNGISSKLYKKFINKKLKKNVNKGELLRKSHF